MPARTLVAWLGLFAALAVAFSWPLPLHLGTHLTGPPSGDTGVYVWNLWVFRHEVLQQHLPLQTGAVLSLAPRVDLTLHNYTLFMDALAFPLVGPLGLLRTFNVVYLAMMALTAWCTARLAHTLCGRAWESWLAGVAFAFGPVLMARSTAHFSLVAAAPLAVLLHIMVRAEGKGRARDAVAIGATLAWAAFCDIYYAVYGVLLVGAYVAASAIVVSRGEAYDHLAFARRVSRGLVIIAATFVAIIALQGGLVEVAGLRISMRSLYTPMLVLTLLVVVYLLLHWAPRVQWRYQFAPNHPRLAILMAATATLLLSPVLVAYGGRMWQGQGGGPDIYWRSSPPGIDLLAFVMPNPNSPLFGTPFKAWIEAQRVDGFAELTGAMPLIVLAVIGVALWTGWRPARRRWLWLTGAFCLLALGPFVHVAGINTYIPGPWALLRYVPIVGLARSPSRFVVVAALLVAVLFAMALVAIGQRWPRQRRLVLGLVTVLLLFELSPVPRPLFAGTVPAVFHRIASDPRKDIRVLSLPFGLRDGTSSLGDFNPLTQYQQTVHGKRLVGGYLSRVTRQQRRSVMEFPVLEAMVTLSDPDGPSLNEAQRRRAFASRDRFLRISNVAYVVTEDGKTSPALRAFAEALLRLEKVASAEGYTLYVPHQDPNAAQAFMASAAPK
ncbi:MAG TPA: hypothetical protein VMF13_18615 [Luteitalea sp.]|nr:hypothetical protein [Luteitalea sp.]